MAFSIAIGLRVVIGNSPFDKSYSSNTCVINLECAGLPSLAYLGLGLLSQTPSLNILSINCLCIASALFIIYYTSFFSLFLSLLYLLFLLYFSPRLNLITLSLLKFSTLFNTPALTNKK